MSLSPIADGVMRRKDIRLAFELPVFVDWPEDSEGYEEAEQPARIGRALVDAVHKHLANKRIGYLYRETMSKNDKVTLAKASKVGAKLKHFAELDFLIEVNHTAWKNLTEEQRVALIDHELCHFGVEDTPDGERLLILGHDLEEFGAIVRRWGLWMPDVESFARTLADQGDLFKQHEIDNTHVTISGRGAPVETTLGEMKDAADRLSRRKLL